MNSVPIYYIPDNAVTLHDKYDALKKQNEILKDALRTMGVDPDKLLENKK